MAWHPYQPPPPTAPSVPHAGPYTAPVYNPGFGGTTPGAGPVMNQNPNPNYPAAKQQWTDTPSTLRPSYNTGYGPQQVAGSTAVQPNTNGVPYANLNSTMYRGGMIGTQQQQAPPPVTPNPAAGPTGYDMYNPATWWWRQPSTTGIIQQNGVTYNQNAIPGGRQLAPGGEYQMQSGLVGVMPFQQGNSMGHGGGFGGGMSPFGGGQQQRQRPERYGY